jgi:GMP synthase-like glutamine amidotransferase
MRALFVMHDHVSPTGFVSDHLRRQGFDVEEIQVVSEANFHAPNITFEFPDPGQYDLIIPMGAPWGAWDESCIGRWLLPEIAWVQDAVARDIPVLGICFGGQLLARALGGTVSRARKPEIGWSAIHSDNTSLIPSGPWFQFHYDSWTVPPGAKEIARNSAASQAFSHGRSLAVQFHPELTASTLEGWLREGGRKQVNDDGQDADALLAHTRAEEGVAEQRTIALLNAFLTQIALLQTSDSL